MPSYGVCARQIYYQALAEAPAGLTQPEVSEAVARRCESLGITPFRASNAKRVLGSLVNDGLVTKTSLEGPRDRPGARVRYRAVADLEGLQEALARPQTTRVVGEVWGRMTTGYNSPGGRRTTIPRRLYLKVPGYFIEPVPRPRVNRLVEDGSWENKAINWIAENGTPIRKWRWKDQRALEAETARRLRSRASQA